MRLAVSCLVVAMLGAGWGCASKSPSASERADQALADPFNYKPAMQDVSGGDLGQLDKDAIGKDLDHVLNP